MELGIKGRVALVTGAGGGIGREAALALAGAGARVMACDINEETLSQTFSMLGGDHAMSVRDLSRVSECEEVVRETVERFGRLDILVNVAAILLRVPIEEVTESMWDRLMDVNLKSQFFLCREACRVMARQRWGRIVNFTSQGAFTGGFATSTAYAISKGGVVTLTKSFARAYADSGICINAIAPGGIDTEMMRLPEKELEKFTAMIPMGRLGRPDELAGVVLFLSSEWASYVTGATIDVTGGQLMR